MLIENYLPAEPILLSAVKIRNTAFLKPHSKTAV
jgi:hypothetical protein